MKNYIVLAVSIIVSLAGLELLLRHYVYDPNHSYIRTPGWQLHLRSNGIAPFIPKDHTVTINRYGYRGTPPSLDADPFIAVIGGSTVEDIILSEHKTWPKRMEARLQACNPNVEVANLGKSGTNARHNLIQLEAVSGYLPDIDMYIVLMGLNDFLYDFHIHHPFETPENWWRDQSFMTIAGDEGRFATAALLKRLYHRYFGGGKGMQLASEFGHYQKGLIDARKSVEDSQWVDTLPDMAGPLETYRNTIRKLKAFADSRGDPIVFVSQPFLWSSEMSEEEIEQLTTGYIGNKNQGPEVRWYTTKALAAGLSAYNNALREACVEEGLICVDLARQLPRDVQYLYDDFHYTERGAAEVGKIVADGIKSKIEDCGP